MEQNKLLECIDFFTKLDIQVFDVTTELEKQNGGKVVEVEYKFENSIYKTNRLYYKDISLLSFEIKSEYQNYFGGEVYWLDIDKHPWPQGSEDSDLDEGVINDITGNLDFRKLLYLIANNTQNGFIQVITTDGRPGQYYHNLENNNHWHDIILLIKEFIKRKGNEIELKYFRHLVFKWQGVKPDRHRTTLAYGSNDEDRKMIKDLMKNIASVQTKLNKMKYTKLLENKHQIILQGPPGTGKTRLAKEIARSFCMQNEISIDDIKELLSVGLDLQTPTGQYTFKIIEIAKDLIRVETRKAQNTYTISYVEIIESFKNKHWLQPVSSNNSNGNASYKIGIAKYIFDNISKQQYKIVQFHPSYSYEDFVRGIAVKTINGHPTYETENRILMQFANDALENYLNELI